MDIDFDCENCSCKNLISSLYKSPTWILPSCLENNIVTFYIGNYPRHLNGFLEYVEKKECFRNCSIFNWFIEVNTSRNIKIKYLENKRISKYQHFIELDINKELVEYKKFRCSFWKFFINLKRYFKKLPSFKI